MVIMDRYAYGHSFNGEKIKGRKTPKNSPFICRWCGDNIWAYMERIMELGEDAERDKCARKKDAMKLVSDDEDNDE